MIIQKIESVKCSKCKSIQMQSVGNLKISGYLCKKCHLYHKKNGDIKEVEFIHNRGKNTLFETDLTFIKSN